MTEKIPVEKAKQDFAALCEKVNLPPFFRQIQEQQLSSTLNKWEGWLQIELARAAFEEKTRGRFLFLATEVAYATPEPSPQTPISNCEPASSEKKESDFVKKVAKKLRKGPVHVWWADLLLWHDPGTYLPELAWVQLKICWPDQGAGQKGFREDWKTLEEMDWEIAKACFNPSSQQSSTKMQKLSGQLWSKKG